MRRMMYVKAAILSFALLLSTNSPVYGFLSNDPASISSVISSGQAKVNSVKEQIASTKGIANIKNAIGDAAASVAKFQAETIGKAKALADKVKKEMEKIQEIKKKIEDAKKKFEEQKAKFDEYKKKIEEAKKKAEEIKRKAEEAKNKVNEVKDKVNEVKDKVNEAKDKVNDVKNKVNDAKQMASTAASTAKSAANAAKSAAGSKISSVTGTGAASGTSSKTSTTKNAGTTQISGGATQLSTGNAPSSVKSGASLSTGALNASAPLTQTPAQSGRSVQLGSEKVISPAAGNAFESLSATTKSSGRTSFTTPIEPSGKIEDNIKSQIPNTTPLVVDEDETELQKVDENGEPILLPAEDKLKAIKEKAAVEGIAPATRDLQATLKDALRNRDEETIEAISQLDMADLVNSKSKIYEENTPKGRSAFTTEKAPQTLTSPDTEKALSPATSKTPQTKTEAIKGAKAPQANLEPIKGLNASEKTPSLNKEKSQVQKGLQKNSFWLNEPEAYQQSIKLSATETLKFASAAGECSEYSNTIRYNDKEEVVIIPEEIAKECCIKAENLTDMRVIRDCMDKIIRKKNGLYKVEKDENGDIVADTEMAEQGKSFYAALLGQQTKNGIRDAIIEISTSLDYIPKRYNDYVEKITGVGKEKTTPKKDGESNLQDIIASITMTNQEMMYLVNNIRRVYASSLVSSSLNGLDNVNEDTLLKEQEFNDEQGSGEYEHSIMRVVDKQNSISVDYPILPENFAKRYAFKFEGGVGNIAANYKDVIQKANDPDVTISGQEQDFISNIQYQEGLNAIVKSTYQKVRAAKYKATEEKSQDENADASTEKAHLQAMLNSSFEITQVIDDIVNLYASRLAFSSIKNMNSIMTPLTTASGS